MARTNPQKRTDKITSFIRLAIRQIQDRTPDQALKTLNNACNEMKILSKDVTSDDLTVRAADVDVEETLLPLVRWYESKIEAIELLITHADKPMDFGGDRGMQLKPEDVSAFRMGATLAKALLGEFPLKVTQGAQDDAEM